MGSVGLGFFHTGVAERGLVWAMRMMAVAFGSDLP